MSNAAVRSTQSPHLFSVERGGLLCEACHRREPSARMVSVDAQKYLRALERGGLGATVRIRVDEPLRDELEGLVGAYLRHVVERDLGSLRVWRELRGEGGPRG